MIILFQRRYFLALLLVVVVGLFAGTQLSAQLARRGKGGSVSVNARGWQPAVAKLMTPFSKSVRPESVRAEYPRPQLVRRDWQSLNGLWQFAFDDQNLGATQGWKTGREFAEQILVPFTFESALSGIGRGSEVHEHIWYRRSFTVPDDWSGRRVVLNFGAVDWETHVFVNGQEVGTHQGGYAPFAFDITEALVPGANELVVQVYDPSEKSAEGWQPRGKQRGSEGIWYTRTTGIWQSVWLEPVAPAHVAALQLTPGLSADGTGSLGFVATLPPAAAGATLTVAVTHGTQTQVTVGSDGRAQGELTLPNVKPWTPETPELYEVVYTVTQAGKDVDRATGYTAFRSVGIRDGRLTLNGKPYFYRGVLDQGYWPDGILTPPSDEALRFDVEMVKKLGFNMARKHIKLEDPRWYYWCDKLGVAVWQDMPSSIRLSAPEARESFTREWREILAVAQSYPCVVHWIPFNENWGEPGAFQDEIVALTRNLDPSRPITDASGWTQRAMTDVIDAHNYSDNLRNEGGKALAKPKVVGEFGGVGLSVAGHVWNEGRIYVHATDVAQLLTIFRRRVSQMYEAENLSGFVYTQLTDVEQELNGLLTYDRALKTDAEAFARIVRSEDRPKPLTGKVLSNWLVLGPIPAGTQIVGTDETDAAKAALEKILATAYLPDEAHLAPQADQRVTVGGQSRTWRSVTAESLDFNALFGNQSNAVAYAVAVFDIPKATSEAILSFGSDDSAQVWLNGKPVHRVVRVRGVNADEDRVERLALQAGRNTLVVKVGQGNGGWGAMARLSW